MLSPFILASRVPRRLVLLLAPLAACTPPKTVKFYSLRGTVKALQPADRIAVIQHETIPGFMESMTMEFPIKDPAEFAKLAVGQRIRATVCQQSQGLDFWLQGIVVEK